MDNLFGIPILGPGGLHCSPIIHPPSGGTPFSLSGVPTAAPPSALPPPRNGRGSTGGSAKRSTTVKWSKEEDAELRNAVAANQGKNWKLIADALPDRTEVGF